MLPSFFALKKVIITKSSHKYQKLFSRKQIKFYTKLVLKLVRIWVVFRFSPKLKLLNNLIIGDQFNSYSFMFSINSQKHGLRLQNDKRLWLWQFDRSKPILSVSLRFDIVVGIFLLLLLSLSPSSVCLVRFKSVNCSSRTRTITW